jgi:2-polyprenyl-6-methoxyphenol hydroxylase-like FAD-dependent oxidoreductase
LQEIVVSASLDLATLANWSRGRALLIGDAAHATSPHAGQGASVALEDALRLARLLQEEAETGAAFANFERERRTRVERIVALARRNGNQKRKFSRASAWFRDQMLKLVLPLNARSQDWIYGYDPRAVTSRPQTKFPHGRLAA